MDEATLHSAMQAMGMLSLAVAAIPPVLVARRLWRAPFRGWQPFAALIAVLLAVHGLSALGADTWLVAIIYLWAGAGRP